MGKIVNSIKNLGEAANGQKPTGRRITDTLKSLGSDATGQSISGRNIADILNDIADKWADTLTVDVIHVPESEDLLGKHASDLQSDIGIGTNKITGTSKYVTGYTGFSSNVSEQSGNYLALKAVSIDGATITGELVGGYKGPVTLDSDGIIIFRVTSNTQSVRFVATKGNRSTTVTYSLSDLVLQPYTL